MLRPIPRAPAPGLSVRLLPDDAPWTLAKQRPRRFTLIVFYRGLHSEVCQQYLGELNAKLEAFLSLGVEPVAISSDSRARALAARQRWGLEHLRIGYGLPLAVGRRWGLFISEAIEPGEPELFCEPGLFLVDRENVLYCAAVTSMPFGRPPIDDVLDAIDDALAHDAPPRGEAA